MKNVMLMLFLVVLGGCATLDAMQGQRAFKPVEGDLAFVYEGDQLSLALDGKAVAVVASTGDNWWSVSQWEGVIGDAYLVARCSEAKTYNGQRECTLNQVKRCPWDATKGHCGYAPKEPVLTQVVEAPMLIYVEGRESKLAGGVSGFNVVFAFDGLVVAEVPAVNVLRSDGYTRLYRGQLGGEDAEIYCRLLSTVAGSAPSLECKAYRDINSRGGKVSGKGFELAVIGRTLVDWSKGTYRAVKGYTERFYVVDRWPRLNPAKPYEVPEANKGQSRYAQLLQKEWDLWAK